MWTCRVGIAGASLVVALTFVACSRVTSERPATEPPAEVSTDDMLVGIATALAGGDVIEATRLADIVEARENTEKQTQMLRLLSTRFGDSDPTTVAAAPTAAKPAPTDAWGVSIVRVRRTVPDSQIDTAGYDALPFFHGYREAASCCQYALFDLGELTVTPTDEPPPVDEGDDAGDRVIVFDFGEFLRRTGIDDRRRVYQGETRVADGRLWHVYEDVTGGLLTGATERMGDAIRTTLQRHAE